MYKTNFLILCILAVLLNVSCDYSNVSAQKSNDNRSGNEIPGSTSRPPENTSRPPENTSGAAIVSSDINNGKVNGNVPKYDLTSQNSKESISNNPPEVWLEFSNLQRYEKDISKRHDTTPSKSRVMLPSEAKNILTDFWQYLITLKEDTAIIEIVNKKNETRENLQKVYIETGEEKRQINLAEAEDIIAFIMKTSAEIRNQSKKS